MTAKVQGQAAFLIHRKRRKKKGCKGVYGRGPIVSGKRNIDTLWPPLTWIILLFALFCTERNTI